MFDKDYLNSRVLKTIHCKHVLLLADPICYFISVKLWIQFSSHMLAEAVMELILCWTQQAGNPEKGGQIPVSPLPSGFNLT